MSDWDKFHIGDKVRLRGTREILEVVDYVSSTPHDYIVVDEGGYAQPLPESELEAVSN